MNPLNFFLVNTQNKTVPFAARKKSVKTFDGLDHQYTPEKDLQQIDTHMIFTIGEQPLNLLAGNQWHKRKMAYKQCAVSEVALAWFLRLHEIHKSDRSSFVSAFKKEFPSEKTADHAQVEAQVSKMKETENLCFNALKVNI